MKLDAVQEAFGKGRREVPARNCGFVREMASFKKSISIWIAAIVSSEAVFWLCLHG